MLYKRKEEQKPIPKGLKYVTLEENESESLEKKWKQASNHLYWIEWWTRIEAY